MMKPKKLTFEEALAELKETRVLSTNLLEPLGIPFDQFLQFAQRPDAVCKDIVERLIVVYEREAAARAERARLIKELEDTCPK